MAKLIDENAIGVLQSFRPYLGSNGGGVLSILESLGEMISGEPAQKVHNAFKTLSGDQGYQTMEVHSEIGGANPFNLFLVLILLLLADDPPASKGIKETPAVVEKPPLPAEGKPK